jgi:hypothetical protein
MRTLLLLALCAAASAQPVSPRRAKLDEARHVLDDALWNGRINTLYELGDIGRDGLDLIGYADDDADWQVRLTAVHFLGKAGPPAAPELAAVVRREPCPHVRLSALIWLERLGPAGERWYRETATPEDVDAISRLPAEYGTERMGKPLAVDVPDEMNSYFFNGGTDLRVCASSERAGRLRTHLELPAERAAAAAPREETVTTADVPDWARAKNRTSVFKRAGASESFPFGAPGFPRAEAARPAPATPEQKRRDAELDKILTPGTPESLPSGAPGPPPRAAVKAAARFESPDARSSASSSAPSASSRTRESFPPGAPALPEKTPAAGAAAIMPDAGTGKPASDPVPLLIRQLSSGDARRRARAADELGKRGAAASKAVPALRRALGDRDRRVRASAALALGSAGGGVEGVSDDLERARRDQDEDVRFSAGIALERLRPKP